MINEDHFAIVKKGNNYSSLLYDTIDTYRYVETTKKSYANIRPDFDYLPQFRAIENIQIAPYNGNRFLLYGKDQDSTLLAASYLTKYIASKCSPEIPPVDDEFQAMFNEVMNEQAFEWEIPDEDGGDLGELDMYEQKPALSIQTHQIPFVGEADFLSNFFLLKRDEKLQDVKELILLDTPDAAYFLSAETVIVELTDAYIPAWSVLLPELQHNIIFVTQDAHMFEDVYK